MDNRKQAYEWVLTISKGDDQILTENQYEAYKKNHQDGKIFFDTFEVNPSYVVSASRQPANHTKKKYPCKACNTIGFAPGRDNQGNLVVCKKCEGTGLDLT